MRFALSSEQRQFAASLHDLLADADTPGAARSWGDGAHEAGLAIWRDLAKAGVTGLAVPESSGGFGADPVDLVVACEELGHHPVPGPAAESVAAVPALLAGLLASGAAADPDQSAGWLSGLASGELIATLALPPLLPHALDADAAGLALLADPAANAAWQALPQARLESADPARRLFSVWPAAVVTAPGCGEAIANALRAAIAAGTLASAALLAGAGRGLLEISVRHASTRTQFGRPIGSFQAVKHRLADVAIALEFARPLLYVAAIGLGADRSGTGLAVRRDLSGARVACADAARLAARTALQVHGAIGYTRECDVSLWLAKVDALARTWGSQAEHRAAVLAALTAGAPDADSGAGPWS